MKPHARQSPESSKGWFRRLGALECILFALPVLFTIGFYWLRSQQREAYYLFVSEDGPAETFQALCLLASAIIGGLLARALFRVRERGLGVLFTVFALGTFLVFCEEISWGQRIVGWSTSGYFEAGNTQKETNLHNDQRLRFFLDPAVLAVSMFAALSPFLHLSFVRRKALRLSFFATELPTMGFFLICAGVHVVYLYLNPVIRPYYNGFDVFFWRDLEMAETFFAAGVVGTMLLKLKAVKRHWGVQLVPHLPAVEPAHPPASPTVAH